jgi:DNA polymerase-1
LTFNPKSRHHIANRLTKLYGWKPTAHSPKAATLRSMRDAERNDRLPIIKVLLEYMLVAKRLEQLAESKKNNSWMQHATQDRLDGGKITGLYHVHGEINQSGAVTHRATHREAEHVSCAEGWLRVRRRVPRAVLVPKGWKMLGADASGLELRCLAHYMAKYDNGAYGKIILEGDVHSENRKALGSLVPQDKKGRDMAKTFIYAYLYGAGDEKLGSIVAPESHRKSRRRLALSSARTLRATHPR